MKLLTERSTQSYTLRGTVAVWLFCGSLVGDLEGHAPSLVATLLLRSVEFCGSQCELRNLVFLGSFFKLCGCEPPPLAFALTCQICGGELFFLMSSIAGC